MKQKEFKEIVFEMDLALQLSQTKAFEAIEKEAQKRRLTREEKIGQILTGEADFKGREHNFDIVSNFEFKDINRVKKAKEENPVLTLENLRKKGSFLNLKTKNAACFLLSSYTFLTGDFTPLNKEKEKPSLFIDFVYETEEETLLMSFRKIILELIGDKETYIDSKTPKFFKNYLLGNLPDFTRLFLNFWGNEQNSFRRKYEKEITELKTEALQQKTAHFNPVLFEKLESGACPRVDFDDVLFKGKDEFVQKNLLEIEKMSRTAKTIEKELKANSFLMSEIMLGKREFISSFLELLSITPENINTVEILNH